MLWCKNQTTDEDGYILCLAHLAENRVFSCPYISNEKRMQSDYPCSDFKDVIDNQDENIALSTPRGGMSYANLKTTLDDCLHS